MTDVNITVAAWDNPKIHTHIFFAVLNNFLNEHFHFKTFTLPFVKSNFSDLKTSLVHSSVACKENINGPLYPLLGKMSDLILKLRKTSLPDNHSSKYLNGVLH